MIRILLVTHNLAFGQQLRQALKPSTDLEVVGAAPNETAAQSLSRQFQPNIALVDLEMPGLSGLRFIQWLTESTLKTQAVALSTSADKVSIEQVLKAGAKGYLLKSTVAEDLAQSLCLAHRGFLQMSPGLFETLSLQSLQTISAHPQQTTVLEDGRWPMNGSLMRPAAVALASAPPVVITPPSPTTLAIPNPAQDYC